MDKFTDVLEQPESLLAALLGDLTERDLDLTMLQMSLRAGLIFLLTLGMVRLAGRRAIGQRTSIDTVVSLLLGALLSRAVVGASSFVNVVAACFVLVVGHRLLTWLCLRNPSLNQFINGDKRVLYQNGVLLDCNMQAALLSKADLQAQIRQKANLESLDAIEAAYMETSGDISIIMKQAAPTEPACPTWPPSADLATS